MNEITYIAVENLYPHRDNPRKDLGDLNELADSIKANGVLQNLTVVPNDDNGETYTVIIGHRRLAAAKLAGLSVVPCVIKEMTIAEQIKTMLVENIQRSELTPYEQAQGFQMMLDLGETVDTIAEKSGFSKTTVRRRVKLLDLDQTAFKKAEERGATLSDYAELDKISSIELKNSVLETIGTKNFNNALRSAIEKEENARFIHERIEDVKEWAEEIDNSNGYAYVASYYRYSWKEDSAVVKPDDTDSVKYFYTVNGLGLTIYKETVEDAESPENIALRAEIEACRRRTEELKDITKRHVELRREFIRSLAYKPKFLEQHSPQICGFAADKIIGTDSFARDCLDSSLLASFLDIEQDDNGSYEDFRKLAIEKGLQDHSPLYLILACAYAKQDNEKDNRYYAQHWDSTKQSYVPCFEPNDELDQLYSFLISIGYAMSDEEVAMQNGSHESFGEAKEE